MVHEEPVKPLLVDLRRLVSWPLRFPPSGVVEGHLDQVADDDVLEHSTIWCGRTPFHPLPTRRPGSSTAVHAP